LSTHILSEVETTCDRALVLDRGKLVAQGPVSELEKPSKTARLVLRGKKKRALELLQGLPVVSSAVVEAGPGEGLRLTLELSDAGDADALETVVKALVDGGLGVREAVRVRAHLEDVFSELTRGHK